MTPRALAKTLAGKARAAGLPCLIIIVPGSGGAGPAGAVD
jgi:hypothetical protein